MWTESWLAYGEILRNSAIGAARFLNKATMLPHVARIATTGKGVTIEIMGKGVNLQEATSPSTPSVNIDAYRKSQGQNNLELPPK